MQYSKYLSQYVEQNGVPNINPTQYKRMMNVIFIEGVLNGIKAAESLIQDEDELKRYQLEKFTWTKNLSSLTGNRTPKHFLEELVKKS